MKRIPELPENLRDQRAAEARARVRKQQWMARPDYKQQDNTDIQ